MEANRDGKGAIKFGASGESTEKASVFYDLGMLSLKRPGAVLALGFGNPLRTLVRACNEAEVHPLFTTGTDDKSRAFTFGGSANVVSLGKKFDERLFGNEFAVLKAADECHAKTILCTQNIEPSSLLAQECARRQILLLTPWPNDKSLKHWEKAEAPRTGEQEVAEEVEWRRCSSCGLTHDNNQVIRNGFKCPSCGKLVRLTSDERIALTFDENSVEEWDLDEEETNALDFPDFDFFIDRARSASGHDEAVRTGKAKIDGVSVAFGVMEPSFIMGSMGHVVGEKLAKMFERAIEQKLPVVVFCSSGGARMQEGLSSLMQMAKVSAAVRKHSDAGLLYISVLCDPTTGGVTASFATLGDVIIAEPGAMIGFAGRRVIQDTIKQALPDDFQSAEFALTHGLIDMIVERDQMRPVLRQILGMHSSDSDIAAKSGAAAMQLIQEKALQEESSQLGSDVSKEVIIEGVPDAFATIAKGLAGFAQNLGQAVTEQTNKASLWWTIRNKGVADYPFIKQSVDKGSQENVAWQSVQRARNVKRPTAKFYIDVLFDDFIELHGDRMFADDGAIVAGIGTIAGRPVTVIGIEKGNDLKEKIARNFGCPQPEGYRKAMRLMEQAQKFGRPIVCLVDTQGAYCGTEAEERGMGGAIAESLSLMSQLDVPVVSVLIGEGGSGGALALAVANKVAMQENAVYSVLSPEGFASILWKDGSRAPEAAEVMKLSAPDALSMNIIEDVIPEGAAPAHENPEQAAAALWLYITNALDELDGMSPEELKNQRYERFRKF